MAYDHQEQEQLADLKAWWDKFGYPITWVVVIALTGYVAWNYWNYYQRKQSTQASQLYEEMQKAITAKDTAKVQRAATDIVDKYGKTAYAQMAAFASAKVAFDANDLKTAKAQLQWVIDHGHNAEYKAIARIRLAGVLLDEKAYDDGLKVLSGEFPTSFAAAVADRKGDILTAQNKVQEARTAYQLALEKADQKDPARQLIQLKLDAIGGAAAQPVAKTVG